MGVLCQGNWVVTKLNECYYRFSAKENGRLSTDKLLERYKSMNHLTVAIHHLFDSLVIHISIMKWHIEIYLKILAVEVGFEEKNLQHSSDLIYYTKHLVCLLKLISNVSSLVDIIFSWELEQALQVFSDSYIHDCW